MIVSFRVTYRCGKNQKEKAENANNTQSGGTLEGGDG